MLKKILSWLFSRTPKVEPYTPAEIAQLRVKRLAEALRDLPPAGREIEIVPARGPKIPPVVRHIRIDTYNHPDLLEITTLADHARGERVFIYPDNLARGSNETDKD